MTVLAALASPTGTLPKFTTVVETTVGSTPTPLSATVCGELGAVVAMVSVPAGCAPNAVGLRVSNILQLAPAASVGVKHGEEELMEYGEAAVTDRELMLIEDAPVFFKVTTLVALVVFTTTLPKFTEAVETVVCAAAKAVKIRQRIADNDTITA